MEFSSSTSTYRCRGSLRLEPTTGSIGLKTRIFLQIVIMTLQLPITGDNFHARITNLIFIRRGNAKKVYQISKIHKKNHREMAPQELSTNRKVKLKPGKGLMDWIRLSNASRLTHHPQMSVDDMELSKHDKITDCWILLYDMVYDVTIYLDFHPGGANEIMRAAGTDATELFNEVHMWVNYRSMLKNCIIGPFSGNRQNLRRPLQEGSEV